MIPQNTVKDLISRHSTLEKELSSGEIEKKKFAEKSKEYSDLNEIIELAKRYILFEKEKNDLEKIINDKKSDKEMLELAKDELDDLIKKNQINEKKLKYFYFPKTKRMLKMQ